MTGFDDDEGALSQGGQEIDIPREDGKVKETGSPPEPPEEVWPCQYLDFDSMKRRLLTFRTVRE